MDADLLKIHVGEFSSQTEIVELNESFESWDSVWSLSENQTLGDKKVGRDDLDALFATEAVGGDEIGDVMLTSNLFESSGKVMYKDETRVTARVHKISASRRVIKLRIHRKKSGLGPASHIGNCVQLNRTVKTLGPNGLKIIAQEIQDKAKHQTEELNGADIATYCVTVDC